MLPKDDPKNPVLMARVRDWSVESIVLSPLVQAQKPAKSLLEALGEAAKREVLHCTYCGRTCVPYAFTHLSKTTERNDSARVCTYHASILCMLSLHAVYDAHALRLRKGKLVGLRTCIACMACCTLRVVHVPARDWFAAHEQAGKELAYVIDCVCVPRPHPCGGMMCAANMMLGKLPAATLHRVCRWAFRALKLLSLLASNETRRLECSR